MRAELGRPAQGDKIRAIAEERQKQARQEDGAKITVPWRGGEEKHLYVIAVPVNLLYFNPDTHRVRAQRTLDPKRDDVLDADPWGEEAQDYLHHLLRCKPSDPDKVDPDYTALKEELEAFDQREPGIITPDGVLVDGNTRCAALKDLGREYIRVGVLPEDTSSDDINNVELRIQLRRDKRREYSYINQLMAIEDELRKGRKEDDVAKDFNIKVKTLQLDRQVYKMIIDVIERSEAPDGSRLRLVDFEDQQEKLRELQRDYSKLAKSNPQEAEQLKESRLAALFLSFPKTSMRLVEPDFYDRYLARNLPDELRPQDEAPETVAVPGLDGVEVQGDSPQVKKVRSLTDQVLRDLAATRSVSSDQKAAARARGRLDKADKVFATAAKLAGQNEQLRKRQIAVPDRITDAADYIRQCEAEFAEAKAKGVLDEDALDDALIVLRDELARLAKHAARAFDTPGDGVQWLLDSARNV
ncbi:transcriptional regulator [Glycomyces sp. A-F 0318]|uniref:transcriptional regulator n=1 Tax=Glycomyces amatae TaxID=2881355 RepID=UPI001E37F974|nr:transcriptional regulator [Glycomyces amatae]MCD0443965.1 transcriptional regulator [Glycomyces amatae]